MSCPHTSVDIIISKDQETVYEVCSSCNKLITMAPYDDSYNKMPFYTTAALSFKEIFEFKNNGMYYKDWRRIVFPGKKREAPARYFLNKALPIVNEKKPMFFSNIKGE